MNFDDFFPSECFLIRHFVGTLYCIFCSFWTNELSQEVGNSLATYTINNYNFFIETKKEEKKKRWNILSESPIVITDVGNHFILFNAIMPYAINPYANTSFVYIKQFKMINETRPMKKSN